MTNGRPKIRTRVMGPRRYFPLTTTKKQSGIIIGAKRRMKQKKLFDIVDLQSERRRVHMRGRFSLRERDMVHMCNIIL
jgi:hypothetical protein